MIPPLPSRCLAAACRWMSGVLVFGALLGVPLPAVADDLFLEGRWTFTENDQPHVVIVTQNGNRFEGRLIAAIPARGFARNEVVLRGIVDRDRISFMEKLVKPKAGECNNLIGWRQILGITPSKVPDPEAGLLGVLRNPRMDTKIDLRLSDWQDGPNQIVGNWKPGVYLGGEVCLPLDIEAQFTLRRNNQQITVADVRLTGLDPEVNNDRPAQFQFARVVARGAGGQLLVSVPFLLGSPKADKTPGFPSLPVCPGDQLSGLFGGQRLRVVITPPAARDPRPACKSGEIIQIAFAAAGATDLTLDPQRDNSMAPLMVRFRDSGQPVPDEPVIWRSEAFDTPFITYSDENGIARLDFAVDERGRFFPVIDGLPTGDGFSDGKITIEAFPGTPLTGFLADRGTIRFTVDLVRPTVIVPFDPRRGVLPFLLDDQEFFVRATLGRRDRARLGNTRELTIAFASGNENTTHPATRDRVPGVYETGRLIASKRENWGRLGEVVAADTEPIIMSIGDAKHVTRFFLTGWHRSQWEARELLRQQKDLLLKLQRTRGLIDSQKEILKTRLQLVANAEAWDKEDHPTKRHRVAVMESYLKMIQGPPAALGQLRRHAATEHRLPAYLQETSIRFIADGEAQAVIAALNQATTQSMNILASIPGELALHLVNVARNLPNGLISGPYVLFSGWTVDGKAANWLERTAGAFETLMLAGGVTSASGVIASRFRMVGTSAKALLRRGAMRDVAPTKLSFAEARAGGALSPVATTAEVQAAAQTAQLSRGARTLADAWKRLNRADGYYRQWSQKLSASREKLARLETELRTLQQQRDRSTRNLDRHQKIVSKWNHVETTKRTIRRRQAKVDYWLDKMSKADLDITRIKGRNLTRAQIQQMLRRGERPGAKDRINNIKAEDHYEAQVAKHLARAENGSYQNGFGITIHRTYRSPLGEGFGAPARPGVQRTRNKPVMDHINPHTWDVADSKYYRFKPNMSEGALRQAAREINDTIEKGRLVQLTKVAEQMGISNMSNARLWRAVCERKVTIYTPTPMPPRLQEILRTLQGPVSGPTIEFKVLAPDVTSWMR